MNIEKVVSDACEAVTTPTGNDGRGQPNRYKRSDGHENRGLLNRIKEEPLHGLFAEL